MGSLGVVPNFGQIYNPDSFTGNGSTTTFTLSNLVTSDQSIIWIESGVTQKPGVDYTISGLTLTRTTAPANGVACFAMYLGVSVDVGTIGAGAVTLAKMAVNSIDSDQYIDGSIDNAHLADDAVGVAELSATGTASSSTFLRGDNSWAAAGGAFEGELLDIRDEKTANYNGGTFTAGAWRTRDLTTVKTNEITGASLGSNQITLPAGDYWAVANAPAHAVNKHRLRLYDTTNSAIKVIGSSNFEGAAVNATTHAFLAGRFTLSGQAVLELQHYGQTTKSSNGYGNMDGGDFGSVEVFAHINIWKV